MQSTRTVLISLIALPAIGLAQSGGIDLLNFAMPNAQIVGGANVTAAAASPLGKFALSQIQSGDANLQKFISETGVDPRTDISELVFASSGPTTATGQWLIGAHGSFGVAISHLESTLEQEGGTVAHLPGVDLIHTPDPAGSNAQAAGTCIALYVDGATALVGDCASVQTTIQSGGTAAPANTNVFTEARKLRAAQDVWVTSVVPLAQFHAALPNELSGVFQTSLFQAVQQIGGGVKFGSTASGPVLQVSGEALMDTPNSATSLLNVLQFIAGMIGTQAGSGPEASLIASVLGSLTASTNGNALLVSLTIPETAIEQLIQSGHSAAERPKMARASR